MNIQIEPVSYGRLGNSNNITISTISYTIGNSQISIVVRFINGSKTLDEVILNMPEETYQNWGTDDQVVIDWVAEELNLTLV